MATYTVIKVCVCNIATIAMHMHISIIITTLRLLAHKRVPRGGWSPIINKFINAQ